MPAQAHTSLRPLHGPVGPSGGAGLDGLQDNLWRTGWGGRAHEAVATAEQACEQVLRARSSSAVLQTLLPIYKAATHLLQNQVQLPTHLLRHGVLGEAEAEQHGLRHVIRADGALARRCLREVVGRPEAGACRVR